MRQMKLVFFPICRIGIVYVALHWADPLGQSVLAVRPQSSGSNASRLLQTQWEVVGLEAARSTYAKVRSAFIESFHNEYANPAPKNGRLKIFIVHSKEVAHSYSVWKVCASLALGPQQFTDLVYGCKVEKRGSDDSPDIDFQQAETLAKAECKSEHEASLVQLKHNVNQSLPTLTIGYFTIYKVLRFFEQGVDVMHVDADVFMFKDLVKELVDRYSDVDIVASPDCANTGDIGTDDKCRWYLDDAFKARHADGTDPLGEQGFMLNTGLMFLRNGPETLHLVRRAVDIVREARVWEQVAFNEALLEWNCSWTYEDGTSVQLRTSAYKTLQKHALHGLCYRHPASTEARGPLRVVVLPYKLVPRSLESIELESLAFHPGGTKVYKDATLGVVQQLCTRGLDTVPQKADYERSWKNIRHHRLLAVLGLGLCACLLLGIWSLACSVDRKRGARSDAST